MANENRKKGMVSAKRVRKCAELSDDLLMNVSGGFQITGQAPIVRFVKSLSDRAQ